MKLNLLLVAVAFSSITTWAAVDQEYNLHCQTKITAKERLKMGLPKNNADITDITATMYDVETLRGVSAVVNGLSDFDGKTYSAEGRRDFLYAYEYKKDSKYSKNYSRFDLANLIDTKTFGSFYIADECDVLIFLPKKALELGTFKAQVTMHCDQNGGRGTAMECSATPKKD